MSPDTGADHLPIILHLTPSPPDLSNLVDLHISGAYDNKHWGFVSTPTVKAEM